MGEALQKRLDDDLREAMPFIFLCGNPVIDEARTLIGGLPVPKNFLERLSEASVRLYGKGYSDAMTSVGYLLRTHVMEKTDESVG